MSATSQSFMKLRVVETHNVTPPPPPPNSTTRTLPLTFADAHWILVPNTQRILLYKIPSISTQHFLNSFLSNLKTSLSTALQIFFPLAGSFTPPPRHSSKPSILCDEKSSVTLKIAEAATGSFDFDHLVGTDKKRTIHVTEFHPLVPDLDVDESTGRTSLFALQVTIFPDCGLGLGITYKHVVADGRSVAAFLHTWASICVNNCMVPDNTIMPVFDRNLIPDPNDFILESILKKIFDIKAAAAEIRKEGGEKADKIQSEVRVRGTFVISKSDLQKLRRWLSSTRAGNEELHLSTFVLACSLIWVNMIKSEAAVKNSDVSATDVCHFSQVVDCRDRYELKSIVPLEYFGNCLACGCFAPAKRADLEGKDGLVAAVRAIGNQIKGLEFDGALAEPENWITVFFGIVKTGGSVFTVAGSPRLCVYGLDFGWGRPAKVEVVSISGAISIAESVDDEGGVEIGLALGVAQMEAFVSIYEESKREYCGSY